MDMPSQRTFGSAAVVAAPPVVAHKLSAVDEAKSFPLVPLSVDSMATGTFHKAARKPGLSNIYLARRYCTAALLSVAGPIGVLKARLTAYITQVPLQPGVSVSADGVRQFTPAPSGAHGLAFGVAVSSADIADNGSMGGNKRQRATCPISFDCETKSILSCCVNLIWCPM